MAKKPAAIPSDLKPWIEAKKRRRLSQAHIQMAREFGMNPKKFGKIDNHRQEPWKAPLPEFIERIYLKRFGKAKPDKVRSFVEVASAVAEKKQARKLAKQARKAARATVAENTPGHSALSPSATDRPQGNCAPVAAARPDSSNEAANAP